MTNSSKPTAAIILGLGNQSLIYPHAVRAELAKLCHVAVENCTPEQIAEHSDALAEVRYLFSGWGAPLLDAKTLAFFPDLEAVFYGSGSIKGVVTEDFWQRDLPICSAWAANAIPVAEFTFAQIILSLKQAYSIPHLVREARSHALPENFADAGAFGTTVGLVSLGQIGCRVATMLKQLDVQVIAFDPFCSPETALDLGVTLVTLNELFSDSRVVSLHAPSLPETKGMITGSLIASLPLGATLINTARGSLIRENEMIETLRQRPDLTALLDVVDPEPAPAESALYDLSNVFLTPHIAGSQGSECGRMGKYMIDECNRLHKGEPLQYKISKADLQNMA